MFARIVLAFVVLIAIPHVAPAAAAGANVPAVRAPHPLPLDPVLTDPAWATGRLHPVRFFNVTRRTTDDEDTVASILYDDKNIYVSFHCEQNDAPIVATQQTNGVGYGLDDFVGIAIDTSGSGSEVYFFEATPHGVRYQQSSDDARYNPVWAASGAVTGNSWNAVMIIPLSAMRFAGASRWRINMFRSLSSRNEHLSFASDGLMADGAVGTGWPLATDARWWPALAGLHIAAQRVAAKPSVDIYGLGSFGRDREEFVEPNGALQQLTPRSYGLDVSYPILPTVNLVATLNPDFSNIEIDQQTISPQEFPRQLVEYRPFFAHGASFIAANPYPWGSVTSPPNLIFYTPNIGAFDRGAKIEGTEGDDSFGLMSFRGYDSTALQTFDDFAYGFRRSLPDRSFIAWLDGVDAHQATSGSDITTEFGLSGRNTKTGFVWMADGAIENTTAVGESYNLGSFVDVHRPNSEINVSYRDTSPHYGPVDGYTAVADLRGPAATFTLFAPAFGFKASNIGVGADRYLDGSGAVREADTFVNANATLKNGFSLDNVGLTTGVLRQYDVPAGPGCTGGASGTVTTYSGAPCYLNGQNLRYNTANIGVGYHEGTSVPTVVTYGEGPFGTSYNHQFTIVTSRPLGRRYSLALEYDGTWERAFDDGELNSQWLYRITAGATLGADENLTVSLRSISGTGGFAAPGVNVAMTYHKRFLGGNELYVEYGTPAATSTLSRLIVKYVLHFGPIGA